MGSGFTPSQSIDQGLHRAPRLATRAAMAASLAALGMLGACAQHQPDAPATPASASMTAAPAAASASAPAASTPLPTVAIDQLAAELSTSLGDDQVKLVSNAHGHLLLRVTGDAAFSRGSTVLHARFKAFLAQLAQGLQARSALLVQITGHTDATGKASLNQHLSEARAKVTAAYLVDQGVAAERIRAEGKGAAEPVASNDSAAGRAANRRVDIDVSLAPPAP